MYEAWNLSPFLEQKAREIERQLTPVFDRLHHLREKNQLKVLAAMQAARFSEASLGGTTGYGYDDLGREKLEEVYARVFGTEAALVRPQLCAGTQALCIALFAALRPGEEILSITGAPYDTLQQVIGDESSLEKGEGSLYEFGIRFRQVPLREDSTIDLATALRALKENTRWIFIQRSRGYGQRKALSVASIGEAIAALRKVRPDLHVFVDNCYGEFTEEQEPTEVGADLAVGSLIKNPGGGLAPTGAYIVGRKIWVERSANRLYAPGLGMHVGPTLGLNRSFAQGFYLAPHVTVECLKGLCFASALFEAAGFQTDPRPEEARSDIIQTLTFGEEAPMLRFCEAVQQASPIDSYVTPTPWAMPGYDCDVIMAAGAFVQGSSIELSADGPVKAPFTAYMQGGLVYENVKLAALLACQKMGAFDIEEVEHEA